MSYLITFILGSTNRSPAQSIHGEGAASPGGTPSKSSRQMDVEILRRLMQMSVGGGSENNVAVGGASRDNLGGGGGAGPRAPPSVSAPGAFDLVPTPRLSEHQQQQGLSSEATFGSATVRAGHLFDLRVIMTAICTISSHSCSLFLSC